MTPSRTLRGRGRSMMLRPMLQCVRCLCLSDDAEGWVAIAREPEAAAHPELATYCPPCADVEVRREGKAPGYD